MEVTINILPIFIASNRIAQPEVYRWSGIHKAYRFAFSIITEAEERLFRFCVFTEGKPKDKNGGSLGKRLYLWNSIHITVGIDKQFYYLIVSTASSNMEWSLPKLKQKCV